MKNMLMTESIKSKSMWFFLSSFLFYIILHWSSSLWALSFLALFFLPTIYIIISFFYLLIHNWNLRLPKKIEKYRIRFIFLQFEKHYFLKFYPKLSIAFPSFKTRKKFLLVWKKFREIPNASKRIKKDKYSESKLSEIIKNKKN